MAWPTVHDYFEAVQNPSRCFLDDELRHGEPARNGQGLPILYAGNFASVFQINSPAGQRSYAIKCFTRKSSRRQERYRHISAHLAQAALPFTVPFVYLEQGIRIGAEWYPILKMEWVDGQTLNQFVGERLDKSSLLKVLAEMWIKLAHRLEEARITHADLQHGNIMLIPGSSEGRVALKLVDYDGMFLPSLQGIPSGELGHPTYQSPHRLTKGYYGAEVDRFSHLVIYAGLRALAIKGRELWNSYDNGDNLLFTQADFKAPRKSRLLKELWQEGPGELYNLAGRLALAAEQPLDEVPQLDEVVQHNVVRSLTADQVRDVDRILHGTTSSAAVRTEAAPEPTTVDVAKAVPTEVPPPVEVVAATDIRPLPDVPCDKVQQILLEANPIQATRTESTPVDTVASSASTPQEKPWENTLPGPVSTGQGYWKIIGCALSMVTMFLGFMLVVFFSIAMWALFRTTPPDNDKDLGIQKRLSELTQKIDGERSKGAEAIRKLNKQLADEKTERMKAETARDKAENARTKAEAAAALARIPVGVPVEPNEWMKQIEDLRTANKNLKTALEIATGKIVYVRGFETRVLGISKQELTVVGFKGLGRWTMKAADGVIVRTTLSPGPEDPDLPGQATTLNSLKLGQNVVLYLTHAEQRSAFETEKAAFVMIVLK